MFYSPVAYRRSMIRGDKMKKPYLLTLIALAALAAGCTATPQMQSGPDAEVTHDGLTRVDKTIMDMVWARSDIDLSGYDKVMFEGVGVEYRPAKGPYSGRAGTGSLNRASNSHNEFRLDDKTKALVEEEIRGAFLEELARSKSFEVVDEAGPNVLALHAGLLDVVSRVPPENVGRSVVFLDSVGEATLVMELSDSMSNAILVRAIDRRAAERSAGNLSQSTSVSNRADVRRLGRRWASIIRGGLETLLNAE